VLFFFFLFFFFFFFFFFGCVFFLGLFVVFFFFFFFLGGWVGFLLGDFLHSSFRRGFFSGVGEKAVKFRKVAVRGGGAIPQGDQGEGPAGGVPQDLEMKR